MITVKVLLGKDTVSIYRKTGDISSVESTAESGGYVITRHFETEAEYKAYAMAVEDLDGHEDWQMLAPAVTPEAPFRKGEFVRLTDDAITNKNASNQSPFVSPLARNTTGTKTVINRINTHAIELAPRSNLCLRASTDGVRPP